MLTARLIGRVRRWEQGGGFGFIRAASQTYFVHLTAIEPRLPLSPGEFVAFTPAPDPRGPRATQVRRLPTTCPKCDASIQPPVCRACGFTIAP